MCKKDYQFATLQIHAGQEVDPTTGSRAVPIYQTTAYGFRNTEHAANLFSLQEEGNIYTRIMNPTQDVLEKRVAALEGGIGALAFASGHAAVVAAVLNIVRQGDEIVASSSLYGGVHNLFKHTFANWGIKTIFVDPSRPENFQAALTAKTKLIYGESLGNPKVDVFDIEAVAKIAHAAGIPLLIDNTVPTPYLLRPIEYGADVVIHSATKFIGGHGTSMGGIIIDSGNFAWDNGKFSQLTEPDESYHGVRYVQDVGKAAYITKARTQMLRDLGACLSPFNCFLLLQGLETLSLRMEKHSSNAFQIAKFLLNHPLVSWVNYPGLVGDSYYSLGEKYLSQGAGALLTFGIKGGLKAGGKFIDSVQLFSHLANIGDVRSLVIHPASTTHQQLSSEDRVAAGVPDDLIRLSIGLEDVVDLQADLDQALQATK